MTSRGTVLVTGCAGFIGSNLVDVLLSRGSRVAGIDSFEPFYPRSAKERNLASALASPDFEFREVDTRDAAALREFALAVRPDTIVDFAARAGVRDSIREPSLYIDINVRGLQNTLSVAAEVGASFVFASSSSVYGGSSPLPFREDHLDLRPVSPYGATKLAGEALVAAHHAVSGLPVRIARLFTVYGPRQRPDLAVHRFASALVDDEPLPLFANGALTRDYTYVGDIVGGVVGLIDCDDTDLTVNLGGGRPYSTRELVSLMETTFGLQARLEYLPPQPGDVPATAADVTKARTAIGWVPRTRLEDGLRSFRDWYLRERQTAAT